VGFFSAAAQLGDRLNAWAGMDLSQPIILIAETDLKDWLEQARLLIPRFGSDPAIPKTGWRENGYFFKATTD
jgi:hypothetical protein